MRVVIDHAYDPVTDEWFIFNELGRVPYPYHREYVSPCGTSIKYGLL